RQATAIAVLGYPALDQIPPRLARCSASSSKVGEPTEAVPGGKPFQSCRWWRPARRGIADELSAELYLAAGDGCAALGISGPALTNSEPEIGRHAPDQSVPIERAARQ